MVHSKLVKMISLFLVLVAADHAEQFIFGMLIMYFTEIPTLLA